MTKLNAMRVLTQHNITYTVREFPDTIHSADGVADYFEISPARVYKTLVTLSDKGKPILVLLAGDRSLDLKKVAKAVGQKKVQMAAHSEAERLTGLQTGGISPLALLHKNFPVYLDKPALEFETILISAGKRGINLELPVQDLINVTRAKIIEAS